MFFQNEADLIQLQLKVLYEKMNQRAECLIALVLGKAAPRGGGGMEVDTALDRKYQALRERLFEDALVAQVQF